MLSRVTAVATTCHIDSGSEEADAEGMHVRQRVFTDRVQSQDPRFDGTNRVTLDIDVTPHGTGMLRGSFELTLSTTTGKWIGELEGHFANGMVVAEGIARGAGERDGEVLHISYRQIQDHPGTPPTATPLAFFDMQGMVLVS